MAEARLPLLAHTGGEHTLPVLRPEFADPRTLQLPLQCGVTVIAAHCGTKSGLLDPDYFPVFVQMLQRYPNLYGDSSAFTIPIRGRHVPECLREPVVSRILHGSDLPVPVLGEWAWLRGLIRGTDYRRCRRLVNLIERDYQLKRAMGFPEEVFTRINDLLRPSLQVPDPVPRDPSRPASAHARQPKRNDSLDPREWTGMDANSELASRSSVVSATEQRTIGDGLSASSLSQTRLGGDLLLADRGGFWLRNTVPLSQRPFPQPPSFCLFMVLPSKTPPQWPVS